MKKQWFCNAVKESSGMILSYEYKCDARQRPEYFSREGGKIGFTNMIGITLNFLTKSMQAELDKFFEVVLKQTERVAKQSYFDARHKLKAEAFKMLFDGTAELASQAGEGMEPATFKGYRVFAIDGTTLSLENTYPLRGYYGVQGAGNGCAAARASVMADVLNKGVILDACIDKLSHGERELATRHYSRLLELNVTKPLLVHDRGYASADMFDTLISHGTAFLFRLQRGFNAKIDRMRSGDRMAELHIKGRVFRLRVLKFELPSGETETLITNVTQQDQITTNELKELYNLRWGVETAYRTIKGLLQIENFTGTSQLLVEQDFYATMFLKNMVAFAKLDADEIVSQNENPGNMYRQQTNENLLIGSLKDKLVLALLEPNPKVQARKVTKIVKNAAKHTVPIRPGRSFSRLRRNSKRFCAAGKGAL